ncbi:hypothetical protein [Neokomagataea thailandica]|nr:hypothetical protein [Neokomagataea thailandica]
MEAVGGKCADRLGQVRRVDRRGINGSGLANDWEDKEAGSGNTCQQR